MSIRRTLSLIVCSLLLLAALGASADEGADRRLALRKAQESLRDKDWRSATAKLHAFRTRHAGTPEALEAWVLEAQALLEDGRAREALDATSDFLKAHGKDAWAGRMRHTAAAAYEKLTQHDKAAAVLHGLVDDATSKEARARIAALHVALADQDFEGVEEHDDLGRPVKKRNLPRALQSYARALAVGVSAREKTRVLENVARLFEEQRQFDKAADIWGRLLKDAGFAKRPIPKEMSSKYNPAVERWLVGRGRSLLRAGKRPDARADLKAALAAPRQGPLHMEILLLLGEERLLASRAKGGDGAFEEGVDYIRRAILEHRDDAGAGAAQRKLAEAYEGRGQSERAAAEWRALIQRFPKDAFAPQARDRAAKALVRAGLYDEAIAEWNRFLAAHPANPLWKSVRENILRAAFDKGAALLKREDADSAVAAWRAFAAAHETDTRAPVALTMAANALRGQKDFDAALVVLKGVAGRYATSPQVPQALFLTAIILEDDLGRLDEAIRAYEIVIKKHGRTGQAGQARARIARLKQKHLQVRMDRVVAHGQPPVLRVETRNIETLRVRVYRLGLEEYFQRKGTLSGVENLQLEIVKPDWTSEWKISDYKAHELIAADRSVPVKERGAYVVVAGDDDLTSTTLFLISDIECVVKQVKSRQLFVWAFDRATHKPIEGARVLAAGHGEVGKTGKDGVWIGTGNKYTTGNVMVLSEKGVAATQAAPGKSVSAGFRSKAYVYTDRPVYRPGANVSWRAIFLEANGGAYKPPAKHKGNVRIFDARGRQVLDEKVTSSDFGTFAGTFTVDGAAPLGTWRVNVTVHRRGSWEGKFQVQEFRKPEFTVEVKPKKRVYLTGETVVADVELRYAFGGAVADAPLRYEVWRFVRSFEPTQAEDYGWYFQDERPRKAERVRTAGAERIAAGELRTDAEGRVRVEFETKERDDDAEYVVRASAMDVTRRWITDEGRIPVTRRDHMAVVKADRKVYRPKQQVVVTVRTVDARERSLSRSGDLQLLRLKRAAPTRLIDKRRGGRPLPLQEEEVEIRRFSLTTNERGEAELRLQFDAPGRYRLRWRSKSRGELVTAYTDVEASGKAEDLSKDARLIAARTLYKEGEHAEVLLHSPIGHGKALITYEGERVLDYTFVDLVGGSQLLELPLEGRHAPNVFFKVAIPGAEKLLEAETEVVVLRHLDVSVEITPKTALPGSEVEVRVTTRDANGRPVKAEIGLALVDETVFAVARDAAPPIRPYFYDRRRTNAVGTTSSIGTRFYGTTRETSKDLLADTAARTGDAKRVYAQSALRLAQEALRRGDKTAAVRQVLAALKADPKSWDARALLGSLRLDAQAGEMLRRLEGAKLDESEIVAEPVIKDEELADHVETDADMEYEGSPRESADKRRRPRARRKSEKKSGDRKDAAFDGPSDNGTIGIGGGAGGSFRGRGGHRNLTASGGGGRAPSKQPLSPGNKAFLGKELKQLQRQNELIGYTDMYNAQFKNQAGKIGSIDELYGLQGFSAFEVRKTFADTASWEPRLATGKDGKASLKVKLPDNLTTWRATARGVSRQALVGSGRGSVVARRNLLVRIDPPRFLTQGDDLTIPTAVHNNTGEDLELTVRVAAEGIELAGSDQKLKIPAGGRAISDRTFAAKDPGAVRIEAAIGAGPVGDAVEVKLGTIARGLKVFDGRSGTVSTERGDAQETFLDVPENVVAGTNRLTLALYPSIDEAVLDALLFLDLYPYGCVEQTVHRFLPALEARAALQEAGSLDSNRIAALRKAAERGAMRLRNLQNQDGSFGWFGRGKGNLAMTAYALRGLAAARTAGIAGLDRSIALAVNAMQRLIKRGAEDERALGHLALASVGRIERESYATTFRRRSDALSVTGMAWLALAAARLDRSFDVDELLRLILERRVEKDGVTYWRGRKGDCFVGSDREATALAVQVLIVTKSATPHAERGMAWLLGHRAKGGLGTTKDTAAFVGAAAAWIRAGRVHGFGGTIEILLDGKVARTIRTGAGPLAVSDRRFTLPDAGAWSAGRHRLGFRLSGEGRLHWAARLESVVASQDLPGDEHGLSVKRSYLVPEEAPLPGQPARVKPGYTILRPAARPKIEPKDLDLVGSGDRVLVRLELQAPRELEYVLIEDPLPAGFEVLADTTKGSFAWQERRDERQVFFLAKVPKGPVVLEYVLQATHLGAFTALGTTAYGMYAPEIHGRAKGRFIRVLTHAAAHAPSGEVPPTPDEVYALAQRAFADEDYAVAEKLFAALRKEQPLRDEIIEAIEAYRLRGAIERKDARGIVRAREELVRRNPGRIPSNLDAARAIAFGYQSLGEQEVAIGLFRDLVARGFGLETGWADTLAARGREVDALDGLGLTLRRFPISNATAKAAFGRAQRYRELPRPKGRAGEAGRPMDDEALDALWAVSAHFAGTALAGPANYALVEALRRAGDLTGAAVTAEAFLRRFPGSHYRDDASFFLADVRFRRFEEEPGKAAAKRVRAAAVPLTREKFRRANRTVGWSPFRERAYHLLARVSHVLGDLDEAIGLYKLARGVEDAREALAFLTEERLHLDDTVTRPLAAGTTFPVRYRNVKEASFKAYPVDLQVLFAVRKTLEGLHKIDLSGIVPAHEWKQALEGAGDHAEHATEVALPVKGKAPGVWLVVAKAGRHEASSLVIKTDLKVVLQRIGEKVRVYVTDAAGASVRGAYVTVSNGKEMRARGQTDGRGIYEAPGVGKTPFVVVSVGERYAIGR